MGARRGFGRDAGLDKLYIDIDIDNEPAPGVDADSHDDMTLRLCRCT